MANYVNRSGQSFAASVGAFTVKMKDRTKTVYKKSLKALVERMQLPASQGGRMPVKTGFLRASLMASVTGMPAMTSARPSDTATYGWDPSQVMATIDSFRVGQAIFFGYRANYANAVEYGYRNQQPAGFQRMAVLAWPAIVRRAISEVRQS